MSTKTESGDFDPPIENRADLIGAFAKGEKPAERWRIGTEHEKFVYRTADHRAPSYDEPGGIRDLLMAMTRYGWEPIMEGDNVIALGGADGNVSLEPAGQLELSGAPLENLHQTCAETGRHLKQVKEVGSELGLGFLGLGMWPDKSREELPIMPKGRYAIMLRHMPRVGTMGLDMMLRTCTVQANFDYASEPQCGERFRMAMGVSGLSTAIFANSPYREGVDTGFASLRSDNWTDVDNARCGIYPWAFEPGFRYEKYVEWALDVPMFFIRRDGRYIPLHVPFRQYMRDGYTAPDGVQQLEAAAALVLAGEGHPVGLTVDQLARAEHHHHAHEHGVARVLCHVLEDVLGDRFDAGQVGGSAARAAAGVAAPAAAALPLPLPAALGWAGSAAGRRAGHSIKKMASRLSTFMGDGMQPEKLTEQSRQI